MPVTLLEVQQLFEVFDSDNSDTVNCQELTLKLYPPPPRPAGKHHMRRTPVTIKSFRAKLRKAKVNVRKWLKEVGARARAWRGACVALLLGVPCALGRH